MRLVIDPPADVPASPRIDPGERAPDPGAGEVVVGIEWGSLNRIDRLLMEGRVPVPGPGHVLGGQGAGRVVAVGAGVEEISIGDLVSVYPYGGCGSCERCKEGNETLCREARLDGVNAPGMLQSHYRALDCDAFVVADGIDARIAALAPTLAVAWHVLVCRGGLQSGETVAICSISSGLGACAGALASMLGGEVVGVARRATLEQLTVSPSWLSRTWASDVAGRESEAPRVDLAVDAVGAPTLGTMQRLVRTGGRTVSVGAHAGAEPTLDLWRLFTREQDLRGSHGCHRADMQRAVDALPRLEDADMVDSSFPLAEHTAAYERLETPGRFGNVMVALG